jgi:hypothetical protein
MGQNAYALEWYEKCGENIRLRMNVPLSRETEELYARLKSRGTFSQQNHAPSTKLVDTLNRQVTGLTVSDITQRSAKFEWTPLAAAYEDNLPNSSDRCRT